MGLGFDPEGLVTISFPLTEPDISTSALGVLVPKPTLPEEEKNKRVYNSL